MTRISGKLFSLITGFHCGKRFRMQTEFEKILFGALGFKQCRKPVELGLLVSNNNIFQKFAAIALRLQGNGQICRWPYW